MTLQPFPWKKQGQRENCHHMSFENFSKRREKCSIMPVSRAIGFHIYFRILHDFDTVPSTFALPDVHHGKVDQSDFTLYVCCMSMCRIYIHVLYLLVQDFVGRRRMFPSWMRQLCECAHSGPHLFDCFQFLYVCVRTFLFSFVSYFSRCLQCTKKYTYLIYTRSLF